MAVEDRFERLKKIFKKIRIFAAFILVYITYNPEGILSYYHWAIKPWFQGFFGKGKISQAGPHSVKALIGVMILIGWFTFLRTTRRKIGAIGILLTVALFATLGWVLVDYGLFPQLGGRLSEHLLLLVISFILMLGVLLPEPSQTPKKDKKPKKDEKPEEETTVQN